MGTLAVRTKTDLYMVIKKVFPIRVGRNPPLYCTLTLIITVHVGIPKQKTKENTRWVCMSLKVQSAYRPARVIDYSEIVKSLDV